jgi:phosphoribosylamine--glycine ligase
MRLLVVGSGAREHALAWRCASFGHEVHAAPGNPGIARVARCHPAGTSDVRALVALAQSLAVDLVVVGPEAPLALGLVDALAAKRIAAFGPTRAAARLESSKAFAKEFMARHGIASAGFQVARTVSEAVAAAQAFGFPCVLKADGLAAGKGVVVATKESEARLFARLCLEDAHFGEAGSSLVVEEFLPGEEASLFFLCDGARVRRFPPARDFKRLVDGDRGPNTGGMGAYAPAPLSPELCARIEAEVALPTLEGMASEGAPFRGLLYVGLMLGRGGARVLEYNARFGDPETQVLLPLLESDPAELFAASARGALESEMKFSPEAAVGVVLAAPGYPDAPRAGGVLNGIARWPSPEEEDARATWCFHAGTKAQGGGVVAAGGRVLTMVARRPTLPEARGAAYEALQAVTLEGGQARADIAFETMATRR